MKNPFLEHIKNILYFTEEHTNTLRAVKLHSGSTILVTSKSYTIT